MVRLLLVFLIASCSFQEGLYKTIITKECRPFLFANYSGKEYILPDSFIHNNLYFKDYAHFPKRPEFTSAKGMDYKHAGDINKLPLMYELKGNFKNWLILQSPINRISLFPYKEDFLELIRYASLYRIYFLGHLKKYTNYQSFLILVDYVKDDMFINMKSVLQINYLNKRITSIRIIAEIFNEGDALIEGWTEKREEKYVYINFYDNSYFTWFSEETLEQMRKREEKIEIEIDCCPYEIGEEGKVVKL